MRPKRRRRWSWMNHNFTQFWWIFFAKLLLSIGAPRRPNDRTSRRAVTFHLSSTIIADFRCFLLHSFPRLARGGLYWMKLNVATNATRTMTGMEENYSRRVWRDSRSSLAKNMKSQLSHLRHRREICPGREWRRLLVVLRINSWSLRRDKFDKTKNVEEFHALVAFVARFFFCRRLSDQRLFVHAFKASLGIIEIVEDHTKKKRETKRKISSRKKKLWDGNSSEVQSTFISLSFTFISSEWRKVIYRRFFVVCFKEHH